MRRWLVVGLSVLLLIAACAALPGEDRVFAVVLCVDREEDTWQVCARAPSYQKEGSYITLEGKGASLLEAMARLDAAAPMHLHYGQVRMVVFSARLAASEGMEEALRLLADREDVRLNAAVSVTTSPIRQVCDALNPQTGTRLSKAMDNLLKTRRMQGVIPEANLGLWRRLADRQSPLAARLTLIPPEKEGEEDQIQLEGAWMFASGRLTGAPLSAAETQLLSLLEGQFRKGLLTLEEETIRLLDAKVKLRLIGDTARLTVQVRCAPSVLGTEQTERALAGALEKLKNKLAVAGCDALGLARQAVWRCQTAEAWRDYHWTTRYQALAWEIRTKVQSVAA